MRLVVAFALLTTGIYLSLAGGQLRITPLILFLLLGGLATLYSHYRPKQ